MTIRLNKNGFFIKNKNNKTFEDIKFDIGFFEYWRSLLEIEGIVTLADLVKIINTKNLYLLEMLTQCSIAPFIKEIDEEMKNDNIDDLASIEIKKYYEARDFGDCSDIYEITTCSGRFKEPVVDKHCPDHLDEFCALDFSHWGILKNVPIIINQHAELFTDMECVAKKYETTITVGNFFNGLFDELCFFGSPKQRDGNREGLENSIKKINDGTAELISWDEIKGDF